MPIEEDKLVSTIQLNISDGGISLSIVETRYGPALEIKATHFGNVTNHMRVELQAKDISKIANVFNEGAKYDFKGKEYVYPARVFVPSECGCDSCGCGNKEAKTADDQ